MISCSGSARTEGMHLLFSRLDADLRRAKNAGSSISGRIDVIFCNVHTPKSGIRAQIAAQYHSRSISERFLRLNPRIRYADEATWKRNGER